MTGRAYVIGGSANLTVIDTRSNTVVDSVGVGPVSGVAFDATTNRVYVSGAAHHAADRARAADH